MKKLAYVAGGAVLTALIMIPVLNYLNTTKATPAFDLGLKISRLGDNAFGPLEPEAAPGVQADQTLTGEQFAGRGGGGGLPTAAPQVGMETARALPPEYLMVNYKYVYQGEPITLDQDKLAILKRIKGSGSAGQMAGLLQSFDLGLADLSSFSQSKVQNVSFVQDKPYGYVINANLEEGVLSIYNNWQTWPQGQCRDQKCYEAQRVRLEDIPDDEVIIKIANDFLAKAKIGLENYGEPLVDNSWRINYDQVANKADYYFPDSLPVIYPLVIDGKKVYEGHGYPAGLMVNVHLKEKKVISVNSLFTQNYQSSMYEAVTDVEEVMTWAEKGGIYSYSYGSDKTYEIEIGEPQLGYFRKWNYRDGENEELLVPALIFPVISQPEFEQTDKQIAPYFNKQNVVVPLIQEIIDEYSQNNDGPVRILPVSEPMPMPAIEAETIAQ